jgi:hypothetical protein
VGARRPAVVGQRAEPQVRPVGQNTVVSGNAAAVDPDLRAVPNTTVNLRFSAVGSPDGFTASATSARNCVTV